MGGDGLWGGGGEGVQFGAGMAVLLWDVLGGGRGALAPIAWDGEGSALQLCCASQGGGGASPSSGGAVLVTLGAVLLLSPMGKAGGGWSADPRALCAPLARSWG